MLCDELKNYERLAGDCRIGQIVIPKEKVDEVVAELKTRIDNLKKVVYTDNSAVIARLLEENQQLKDRGERLYSCLNCLVQRDLIKDTPEKKSAMELLEKCK